VAAANGAGAEESDRDPAYRRLNESFVERRALPRYAQLADAAAALDAAGRRFCEASATVAIDEVRSAFHAAADAWHAWSTSGSARWNPGFAPSGSPSGPIRATRPVGSSASSSPVAIPPG
jgi:predicted lipoprotein